jgi:xanthine dehydrogenase YagT iron-sulfur-binding subunit
MTSPETSVTIETGETSLMSEGSDIEARDDAEAISRREFMKSAGVAVLPAGAAAPIAAAASDVPTSHTVRFTVNGQPVVDEIEPRVSLLDFLRDRLRLTGTKKGCNEGACGTCTVLVDGKRMNACLTLAVQCSGREVTTIEGIAPDAQALHPVQAAFIRHDAFQCGYCTPGQIVSAVACIAEGHTRSEAEVREWMSGNLCRCSAYPQITAAVLDAAGRST